MHRPPVAHLALAAYVALAHCSLRAPPEVRPEPRARPRADASAQASALREPPAPVVPEPTVAADAPDAAMDLCGRLRERTMQVLRAAVPPANLPTAQIFRRAEDFLSPGAPLAALLRCVESNGHAWGLHFPAVRVNNEPGYCISADYIGNCIVARVVIAHLAPDGALATRPINVGLNGNPDVMPGSNCCAIYGGVGVDALDAFDADGDSVPEMLLHVTQGGDEGHHAETVAFVSLRNGRIEPFNVALGRAIEEGARSTRLVRARDVDRDGRMDLVLRAAGREHCASESGFCYYDPGPYQWARALPTGGWARPQRASAALAAELDAASEAP